MTIQKREKLKNLQNNWPHGAIVTSIQLRRLGISRQLVQSYIQQGWVKPLGSGAYQKAKDQIKWYGALASLQQQNKLLIHVGGPTAMAVWGASHYLRLSIKERVFLFSEPDTYLPRWFYKHPWKPLIKHIKTSFLGSKLAIKFYNYQNVKISLSSLERAIMECLYISPKHLTLLECYQMLEGLRTLRPSLVQKILVNCNSIKVKRLFLYMAEKANLPVFKKLKLRSINLGSGDRSIVKNGLYNSKYKITLPKELIEYE